MHFFAAFLLMMLCLQADQVQAAFVKYIDKNGKAHYVNTEYSRVPDEYLDQVRDQLPQGQNPSLQPEVMPSNAEIQNSTQQKVIATLSSTHPVEIFVKSNCPNCDQLETLLQANKIPYSRFDIEFSPQGKEFFQSLTNTNMDLPLTRINGQILTGIDISAIKTALRVTAERKGL